MADSELDRMTARALTLFVGSKVVRRNTYVTVKSELYAFLRELRDGGTDQFDRWRIGCYGTAVARANEPEPFRQWAEQMLATDLTDYLISQLHPQGIALHLTSADPDTWMGIHPDWAPDLYRQESS